MTDFLTIIDHKGLPHAWPYYQVFPREPSPAGHMSLDAKTTKLETNISLSGVLGHMAKVDVGGTVLIICHGSEGPLLPLFPNDPFKYDSNAYKIIAAASDAEDKAAKLNKLATKKQKPAWKEFLKGLGLKFEAVVTLELMKKAFAQWFEMQAFNLQSTPAKLRQLINKMKAVRERRLDRVELRACNGTQSTDSIHTARLFFGADACLASIAQGTFYVGRFPIKAAPNKNFLRPLGTATGRARKSKSSKMRRFLNSQLALKLWELDVYKYQLKGAAVPPQLTAPLGRRQHEPDWTIVKKFVHKYVMPAGHHYTGKYFPLAGLYAPKTSPNKVFVLPNEAEYVKSIVWTVGQPGG